MAYTPPNSFTNNTPFVASAVKANDDALKIYLHEGIVGADLLNSAWVETRHVQAPVIDAFSGVQHGITGYQGAQWDGGTTVRAQFGSAFLTGKRYGANTTDNWEVVPQTCFSLDLRRQATVIFHWWMESVNGPDNGERTLGNDAYMWVTEYTAGGLLAGTGIKSVIPTYSLEVVNSDRSFSSTYPPGGANFPYSLLGYGNMSGVKVFTTTDRLAVGLAHLSTIDRSAIINWGIALEVYYL